MMYEIVMTKAKAKSKIVGVKICKKCGEHKSSRNEQLYHIAGIFVVLSLPFMLPFLSEKTAPWWTGIIPAWIPMLVGWALVVGVLTVGLYENSNPKIQKQCVSCGHVQDAVNAPFSLTQKIFFFTLLVTIMVLSAIWIAMTVEYHM